MQSKMFLSEASADGMRLTLTIPFSKTAAANELQRRTNPRWYGTCQVQSTVCPLRRLESSIKVDRDPAPITQRHRCMPLPSFVIVCFRHQVKSTLIPFDLGAQARSKTIKDRLDHSPLPWAYFGSAHSFERRSPRSNGSRTARGFSPPFASSYLPIISIRACPPRT